MTFLKFFKFKQAKDETNLQDKLDLGRRWQIASQKDLKHSPNADKEAYLRELPFPSHNIPKGWKKELMIKCTKYLKVIL